MYATRNKERQDRLLSAAATALYIALLLAFTLSVSFTLHRSSPTESMMIEFEDDGGLMGAGSGEEGGHPMDAPAAAGQADATPATEQAAPPAPLDDERVLTQDVEPAPAVSHATPQTKPQVTPREKPTHSTATATTAAPKRQVDQQSLFPGTNTTSAPASSATTVGGGSGTGGPMGGTGSEGIGPGRGSSGSYQLDGRGLVGSLPRPPYPVEESGRVVVAITVDASGAVVGAAFRPAGSTTQNPELVTSAVTAARKARFTPSKSGDNQAGTITYIFKLN